MARSFPGGVVMTEEKRTAKCPVRKAPAPDFVTLPLKQHYGEAAIPLVKVGDRVLKGQKIAEAAEGISCPVHSGISGTVTSIASLPTHDGESLSVVIENDYKEELSPEVSPFPIPIAKATPEELISHMKEKGIVGLSGGAFPTWYKAEFARGKARRIIINCCECEPYITVDHRVLLEHPEEVVGGVKILLCAIGAERAVFAVDDKKEDAAEKLMEIVRGSENFAVALFKNKYPQGDERLLVRAVMGREIPQGGLPTDVGAVVFNAGTCYAVYRAFVAGMPLVERAVTVDGDCVKEADNILVPLGTSFAKALEFCGGISANPDKLIAGGAMMGTCQWTDRVPVTKEISAVLAITSKEEEKTACIRCGRCVRVCPMRLMPAAFFRDGAPRPVNVLQKYSVMTCNECGCCTYVCPARIPILEYIRWGKKMCAAAEKAAEEKGE